MRYNVSIKATVYLNHGLLLRRCESKETFYLFPVYTYIGGHRDSLVTRSFLCFRPVWEYAGSIALEGKPETTEQPAEETAQQQIEIEEEQRSEG